MKYILPILTLLFIFPLYGYRISGVEVTGNVRTEKSVVESLFSNKGDLSEKEIDEILKSIYEKRLFKQVEISYDDQKGILRVKVEEHPIIKAIRYEGEDEIDRDDIKGVVDLKINTLLDLEKVRFAQEKIEDLYREKGFLMARVKADIEKENRKNETTVVFKISEGEKSRVKKITILGNRHLDEDSIKEILNTKEESIFTIFGDSGYNRHLLEEDRTRITVFYMEEGFLNIKVNKPVVTISSDKRYIYVTFVVNEGKRYKVGKVNLVGDKLDSGEYPDFKSNLKPGDWYRHSLLYRDMESLKRFYGDEGYPFVTVSPRPMPDESTGAADIHFVIQKGQKCTVERIEIEGNDRSKDKVIRRELKLFEGELYSYTGFKRSENRVRRTGFYDEVTILPEKGTDPEKVRIKVRVKERKSGTFNVGAGYSTLENFVLNAKVEQNNFLGYGQSLSLAASRSSMRTSVNFNIFEPYFLDYELRLNLGFYNTRIDYSSTSYGYYADRKENRYGFNVMFGLPVTDNFTVSLGYRLSKSFLEGETKRQLNLLYRDLFLSTMETRVSYDRRNDRVFPTDGFYTSFTAQLSHKYLGSDDDILRMFYNFRFYKELFWDLVFRVNFNTGWKRSLGGKRLPISERDFIGGMNTVRGYPYSSIGPEELMVPSSGSDVASDLRPRSIGGDKNIVINNELEFPLVKEMRLKLVGFLDAGNAWNEDENYFYIDDADRNKYDLPLGLYWSYGFGLRWVTPIAPLSFEWGFPLTPRPGDPSYTFEFNIKNSF